MTDKVEVRLLSLLLLLMVVVVALQIAKPYLVLLGLVGGLVMVAPFQQVDLVQQGKAKMGEVRLMMDFLGLVVVEDLLLQGLMVGITMVVMVVMGHPQL